MRRPTASERKTDYLDIGMQILTEFSSEQAALATADALSHVLVAEVAERAGVTKGSVYHIWPTQEDYRRDLLKQVLARNSDFGTQQLSDLVEASSGAQGNPVELLLEACDGAFDNIKDDPLFYTRFSFYLFATNPEVSDLLQRGDEAIYKLFGEAVDLFLTLLDRRVREPFSTEMIVSIGASLLMGLSLRYRISPEVVDGHRIVDPSLHSRFATGFQAVCLHFSEPVPQ